MKLKTTIATICLIAATGIQIYAAPDYFLEALHGGQRRCLSPDGGQMPFDNGTVTVNYWNIPKAVRPGQSVTSVLSYTLAEPYPNGYNHNAVTYKTVLAEWQTNSPIAILENGELEGGPGETRKSFAFTAPLTPGTYRLRLAMAWAFQGITHFFGNGPAGDSWSPGVGDFAEVIIRVETPPTVDYFLEALHGGQRRCLSPDGGQMPFDNGTVTVNYWNIPKVVRPGQSVASVLSYTLAEPYPNGYNHNAVTYKTVLAEWQTNSPIAILENGELEGGPGETNETFSFTAPLTPGTYRLRLAMAWAFQGITQFFGNGPAGDSWNPGVGDFAEVIIRVDESDVDSDGLPDSWELQHFGDLSQTAAGDPDADNWTNAEELANGTNPSTFDIGPASFWTAVEFGWRSVAGRNYQVQCALSPNGPWQNWGAPLAGTGSPMTILDSTRSSGQKYYRVTLAP